MALKKRIYVIVAGLILVAAFIGGVGIYAMHNIYIAMEHEASINARVSQLKDIRSEMQNVLIGVREIVINTDAAQMAREKAAIDKVVAERIDPQLAALKVEQGDTANLQRLKELWTKHKEIVERIYQNTYANTSVFTPPGWPPATA